MFKYKRARAFCAAYANELVKINDQAKVVLQSVITKQVVDRAGGELPNGSDRDHYDYTKQLELQDKDMRHAEQLGMV